MCKSNNEIKNSIYKTFAKYEESFPSLSDTIFLKPNLNSNMNALTGNTTDLRILVSTVNCLQEYGFKNIIIGDGTSSGFYRNKISVFKRLKIDAIADYYGVKFVDLNYEPSIDIQFENGVKAKIAKICVDSDYFINLPKLKSHFETGMSVCLKNLVGCLVGLENKQKVHYSLYKNILALNKKIKPDLHIVDGLFAMEGPGPSKGQPLKRDLIIAGRDPYHVDLVCAKIAGFTFNEVHPLRVAIDEGIITKELLSQIDEIDLSSYTTNFKKPVVNPLVSYVNDQKRQKYFIRFRLAPFINEIFNVNIVGKLLNNLGLRQDIFNEQDATINDIGVDKSLCFECNLCLSYCPQFIDVLNDIGNKEKGCLNCLYCYFICPEEAIIVDGDLGFIKIQNEQYGEYIKKIISGR